MTQPIPATRICLLAATLAGLAAAFATFCRPVDAPEDGEFPNTLSLGVQAFQGGNVGVGFDFGAGFNPSLCRYVAVAASDRFKRVDLPLPAGTIVGLQLILPDGHPRTSARNVRVLDSQGRMLLEIADSDLRADGRIAMQTNLHLPTDPRRSGSIVRRERAVSAVLAVAELAVLIALWRRRDPVSIPGWLSRTAVGLAAVAILFSRRPSVFVAPQFWAEDGTVYFLGRTGGWHGLWETQGNYLALVPRATAAMANLAPVWYAPIFYLIVATAVCLATAMKAASPRVGLPFPALAGLAVVLVPNMDEITANVANAQWFGAAILVLVCLSRPPTGLGQAVRDTAALVIFGLTGPFIIFAVPLLLWRAVRTRSTPAWMLAALGAALVVLQYRAYGSSQPAPLPNSMPPLIPFLAAAGYRTGGQLFGLMRPPLLANPIPWGIAGLVLYGFVWLCFPLRTASGDVRPALAWMALAVIVGGFLRYLDHANLFFEQVFIARYFYLPLLFAAWLLLGGLATPGSRRWLAALGLAATIACNVSCYRMAPYIDLHWPHYAWAIGHGEPIQVPINPPAWSFSSPGSR
ncbi:MAG: hypothetical protein ABSA05_12730 [Opitutaceae bacterium]|jgi:hypothetical protein